MPEVAALAQLIPPTPEFGRCMQKALWVADPAAAWERKALVSSWPFSRTGTEQHPA